MISLVLQLTLCLSVPVCLYLFFDLVSKICFRFYIAGWIKLVKKFFVQFSLFKQTYFSDLYFKAFVGCGFVTFVQAQITHDPFSFLIVKSSFEFNDDKIIVRLSHQVFTNSLSKIF